MSVREPQRNPEISRHAVQSQRRDGKLAPNLNASDYSLKIEWDGSRKERWLGGMRELKPKLRVPLEH
jgi:hypothetical protein